MRSEFDMSMIGELNYFLGLQIKQSKDGIYVHQSKYVKNLLTKFGFEHVKPKSTPMNQNSKLTSDENGKAVDIKRYRGMIGCLLYLTASRPDICIVTLRDFGIKYGKVPIYCDNTSTINISKNPVNHSRTKHIDVHRHFLRDNTAKGKIELVFVPTEYQLAYFFTFEGNLACAVYNAKLSLEICDCFTMVRATRKSGLLENRSTSKHDNIAVYLGTESADEMSHTPDSKKLKFTLYFNLPDLEQRFTENALDTCPILPGIPVNDKLLQQYGALSLFQTVGMDSFILNMPKTYYPDLIQAKPARQVESVIDEVKKKYETHQDSNGKEAGQALGSSHTQCVDPNPGRKL
ncbi:hypothetical protein AgCh_000473 [Apium graveolens]